MPRKSRIDTPGALHHIIGRGINRQEIFTNQKDYVTFLDRLGDVLIDTKTSCYAWALIPNHFHILIRTGQVPISVLMKRLLTGYAVNYNRRHNRSGHLFQNRYKSILCQEDSYLLELIRYIHLNPLRAKLISEYESLERYPYSGHGILMGVSEALWQDTEYILRFFGDKKAIARRKYNQFVRNGIEQGARPDLTGGGLLRSHGGWVGIKELRESGNYQKGDERILGNGAFVKEVLSNAEENLKDKYRLKAEGYDLEKLICRVTEITHLSREQILDTMRDAKRIEARSILCFWASDKLGVTQSELALLLKLTQSAVSHAVRRGRILAENNCYSLKG
jgi:REP element-mobilizing transposase RayT